MLGVRGAVYVLGLAACLMLSGSPAFGLTFTATGGGLAAEVVFDLVGDDLSVTLTNTSAADVVDPVEVLTAVFFCVDGDLALTPVSATLSGGSVVLFPPATDVFGTPIVGGTYPGGNVGAEWAYADGLSGAPGGADQGISSSGLGLFGPADRFDTVGNLQGPADPNGLQYGITSAGDNPATGNTPVTGKNALIQDSVLFMFVAPDGFSLEDLGCGNFQYGTSLADTNVPVPVPEPTTAALLGLGVAALLLQRAPRSRVEH